MEDIIYRQLLTLPGAREGLALVVATLLAITLGSGWRLLQALRTQRLPWNLAPIPPLDLTHVAIVFCGLTVGASIRIPGFLHLAALTGTLGVYLLQGINVSRQFGLSGSWLEAARLGGWVLLAIYLPLSFLNELGTTLARHFGSTEVIQPAVELFLHADQPSKLVLLSVMAVVWAPLGEELFFRGLFQPVCKRLVGTTGSILVVAACFALAHFHWPTALPLFFLGVVLGILYETTGSLLPGMILHALFNLITVVLLLIVRQMGITE